MINEHLESWLGYNVQLFDEKAAKSGKIDYKNTVYRIAVDWDSKLTARDLLHLFAEDPACVETPGIIIGAYAGDDSSATSQSIVELLVSLRAKFPQLKGLFLGDIICEENEVSWIRQSDVSSLFAAYPNLKHFRVRGTDNLSLGKVRHENLLSLVVETGGMPRTLVEEITQCEFPKLEHLELWLGTDGYGWDGSLTDILPFLDSAKYPNLKYLGLRNSDIEDEIAAAVVRSSILPQLEVLDLSLGVLSDEGAKALLLSDDLGHLEKLDLRHHYISPELQEQLTAKYPNVDLSYAEEGDEDDRYVSVGE